MNDIIIKSVKNILTLAALAMAILVPTGQLASESYHNIVALMFMFLGLVVTIVVIAALMRKDLKRIEEQQQEFGKIRDEIVKLLAEIRAMLEAVPTKTVEEVKTVLEGVTTTKTRKEVK